MKHIFIINPSAGKRDGRERIYTMAEALRCNHKLEVSCMLTDSPGHATALSKAIASSGEAVRFYACGGDGTINEVANGIVGFDNAAMTCIPIGTGNDFLKNFGSDFSKFYDAENLWDGPVQQLDLIECNDRYCLTIACSGIDARIAQDVHTYDKTSRILDGKGAYIASLVVNFLFRGIGRHWTVTIGDKILEDDYALVAVCNGRYYGGGFMPVAEARMNDGLLNTLIVKNVSRATFTRFVIPYSKGKYRNFPQFAKCYTAPEIQIHSQKTDITTCLDGEIMLSSDVRIRLSPQKLNFFGPIGCDPNATAK